MEKPNLEFIYGTHQVAQLLNIGRSTVNKYARSLEDAGYRFTKDEKERRAYTEKDIIAFRSLIDLLHRGVDYSSAINTVTERYNRALHSDSVAVIATSGSSHDIAMLNEKVDELMIAVSSLSERIDEIVSERVRSEVAATSAVLSQQVSEVLQEVREIQQQTDQKLDEMVSRLQTHGKRKKFLGLF